MLLALHAAEMDSTLSTANKTSSVDLNKRDIEITEYYEPQLKCTHENAYLI